MRSQPMLSLILLALAYFLLLIQDQSFEYTLDFTLYGMWASFPSAVPLDSWTIDSQLSYIWVPSLSAIKKNIENKSSGDFTPSTLPEQYEIGMIWNDSNYVAYDYSPTFAIVTKQKATETATSTSTSTSKPAETATSTPQSIPKPEATSKPNSTGQTTSSKIGMGIGVGIGGALVLSVAGCFIYRRGKKAALQELTKMNGVEQNGDAMWTGKPELSGKGKDPNGAE
ncbi:hypothetical protein V8F06_010994 [Rhypophila decipiens]